MSKTTVDTKHNILTLHSLVAAVSGVEEAGVLFINVETITALLSSTEDTGVFSSTDQSLSSVNTLLSSSPWLRP